MKFIDLTGKRFGNWVVIEDKPTGESNPTVTVKCDCGNVFTRVKHNVKRGGKCHKCRKLQNYERLVGQKNNYLTVIDHDKEQVSKLLCRCDCGNTTWTERWQWRTGHKKSCGCMHGNLVTIDGVTKNISNWSKVLGVSRERGRILHKKGLLECRVREHNKRCES